MGKSWWIQIFILPNLRVAAAYLRSRDADSSGGDDEAAEAIEYAVMRLEAWIAGKDQTPTEPEKR